jgi:hypothetical protein
MEDWSVLHHDVYPAYISWEEFMGNQARLADNASRYHEQRRGAVRDGPALLVGLAMCARCGRLLHVEYKQHHHYVCSALAKECGVAICLYLAGDSIDAAVVEAFFSALQPAELALLDDVLASQQADHVRLQQQYRIRWRALTTRHGWPNGNIWRSILTTAWSRVNWSGAGNWPYAL